MMRRNARMKRDVFLADIGTRPLTIGILNVTTDSFFDGGRYIAGERIARQDRDGGCLETEVARQSFVPLALPDIKQKRIGRMRGIGRGRSGESMDEIVLE